MKQSFSYDAFLKLLEHAADVPVDETSFSFDDDAAAEEHMLGYIRSSETPYWAGYCDMPEGCAFRTAAELLEARIFDGKSIKERWTHIIWYRIGGISLSEWLADYGDQTEIIR